MRRLALMAAVAAVAAGASAATTGSCEGSAASVKFGAGGTVKVVALTPEYDEDDKSYDTLSGDGVYYLKATLNRGSSYTIWTTGVATNAVSVTAYAKDSDSDDKDEPSADFEEVDETGNDVRLILSADDWYIDEEDDADSDPKSWTYIIAVSGPNRETVTLHFAQGVVYPLGREENPYSVAPAAKEAAVSAKLGLGNEYHFRARLTAGRLYSFSATGGTESNALSILVEGEDAASATEDDDGEEYAFESYPDPAFDDDDFNDGVYVVPGETGYFIVTVSGDTPTDDEEISEGTGDEEPAGAPFRFTHSVFAAQTVASHAATALTAGNGYSAEARPGAIVSAANAAEKVYDEIIDEELFSFAAEKGARYVARTTGAATNLLMRVYDAGGGIVAENGTDGVTSDVRCGWEASSAGTYYVGVCQALSDPFAETPAYTPVTIGVTAVAGADGTPDAWDAADDTRAGATMLAPATGAAGDAPESADPAGSGPHELGATDWEDVFAFAARRGVTYSFSVTLDDPSEAYNSLAGEIFTVSGTSERAVAADGSIAYGSAVPLSYTAAANGTCYLRLYVAEGRGLDHPKYTLHAMASDPGGAALGSLRVDTPGADSGAWTVGSESVAYAGGSTIALPAGTYTVKFARIAGFSQPADQTVTVAANGAAVVTARYSDTFDPRDDADRAATPWTLKNVATEMPRTLWPGDVDHFAITGKDGLFHTISFSNNDAAAAFTITNALSGTVCEDATELSKVELPASKAKYILVVKPGEGYSGGGAYALSGIVANVGAVKFAKTAVAVKEDANSVALTVNRTAKDGVVRVRYATVDGTARAGVDYVHQAGVLEWANGDNKAKTVTVKLIPDLVAEYEGGNKTFSVRLEPMDDGEIADDEYKAAISGGDTATVTLTETSKPGTTVESTYATTYVKRATVATEDVPTHTGTFNGLLRESSEILTNGAPALASIVFTASARDALSAKVTLAGKSYSFKASSWGDAGGDGIRTVTMTLPQTVNRVVYTNTLTVSVASGATADPGDWAKAGGEATLVMNVPDANGRGVQEGVTYTGGLWRDNSKIQGYLDAVANFGGYYTVALVPAGVAASDGIPYGNGFLTVTIDGKGKAKVAGQLPDGTTKPSLSVQSAIVPGDGGDEMVVPIYYGQKAACFGGTLRIALADQATGVRSAYAVSAEPGFLWLNDNADLTRGGTNGWKIAMTPVGGWYDKVANLQAYYIDAALNVDAEKLSGFPKEALAGGYAWSADAAAAADGCAVDVAGNAFATDRASLVKSTPSSPRYDFAASVNPANVQVKLARATGLVTGGFDAWSDDGARQARKAVKHSGVLVFGRDPAALAWEGTDSFGYFTIPGIKLPKLVGTGTRNWTFSAPFNLTATVGTDPGGCAGDGCE